MKGILVVAGIIVWGSVVITLTQAAYFRYPHLALPIAAVGVVVALLVPARLALWLDRHR